MLLRIIKKSTGAFATGVAMGLGKKAGETLWDLRKDGFFSQNSINHKAKSNDSISKSEVKNETFKKIS